MTKINRYKLYKHKKQWVIGCSSVLLSVLMGMTSAHADQTNPVVTDHQPQTTQVDQPTANVSQSTTDPPASSAPTTSTTPTVDTDSHTAGTTPQQPAVTNDLPSSSDHPTDWGHNYERHIYIYYYDHYDSDGGTSGTYNKVYIRQLAKNGHWDELNWYPPEGTFPPGVTVPPIHFDAGSPTSSANQHWVAQYCSRFIDFQTATGHKIVSLVFPIINGQTINVPEMEIPQSDIPSAYHPKINPKHATVDNVIERDGHYYLTGATISEIAEDAEVANVVYHGANGDMAISQESFGESVIFSAPVNYVFKDLNGNTYSTNGHKAVFQNVQEVDYGQTLYPYSIYFDALNHLKQYISQEVDTPTNAFMVLATSNNNFQIFGYFTPDGQFHQIHVVDYPDFEDAKSDANGLTYQFAIVNKQYHRVGDPVTKTRTIIVTKPDGSQERTTQTVTLAQFAYYDQITGKQISDPTWDPTWKVLTGEQPDSDDDWQELNSYNHSWDVFTVIPIAGYTPSQNKVETEAVTTDTQDQTIKISYTANPQSINVIYKDYDDGNKVINTTVLNGVTGSTVDVNLNIPEHYTLLSIVPKTYTFKASDNKDIIVELGHQKQANRQTKDVTRTIIVTDPFGHTTTTTQKVTLTQNGTLDLVTNKTSWGSWTTGHWDSFNVPTIDGYTPSQSSVAAQTVTKDTKGQTIKISYTANSQSIHIIYKDGNRVIKTDSLDGKTNHTVDVKLDVPAHYKVINHPASQYTFKATDNQDIIVQLGHETQSTSQTKDVIRTIIVTDPFGHTTTTTQKVTLTQSGTLDLVTNKTSWGSWNTGTWQAFNVPTIAGYTPSQSSVAAQTVNENMKDQTIKISYRADDQDVKIVYVTPDGQVIKTVILRGQTDTQQAVILAIPAGYQLVAGQHIPQTVTMKPNMADIRVVIDKTTTHDDQSGTDETTPENRPNTPGKPQQVVNGQSPATDAHNSSRAAKLPQTGNDDSTASEAAGLLLTSALFMLGLGCRKRQ